ncbi:17248_t:CDS:1, partial [Funneliformis caledonium]
LTVPLSPLTLPPSSSLPTNLPSKPDYWDIQAKQFKIDTFT